MIRGFCRLLGGGRVTGEVIAEGQCPVLKGDHVVEELGVVSGQADHVPIGNTADPAVFLDHRMELLVRRDE